MQHGRRHPDGFRVRILAPRSRSAAESWLAWDCSGYCRRWRGVRGGSRRPVGRAPWRWRGDCWTGTSIRSVRPARRLTITRIARRVYMDLRGSCWARQACIAGSTAGASWPHRTIRRSSGADPGHSRAQSSRGSGARSDCTRGDGFALGGPGLVCSRASCDTRRRRARIRLRSLPRHARFACIAGDRRLERAPLVRALRLCVLELLARLVVV